jgi:predicted enzyme related to lactoylglutathione lyase
VGCRAPAGRSRRHSARANGDRQSAIVGDQFAGRVGLFVRVEDFNAAYARVVTAGVTFLDAPREETYGRVAVFLDFERNRWELLGSGLPA